MNRNRKNVVRLTESKLRGMIKESVISVLHESNFGVATELADLISDFGSKIDQFIQKYPIDETNHRKIGMIIHDLHSLILGAVEGKSLKVRDVNYSDFSRY